MQARKASGLSRVWSPSGRHAALPWQAGRAVGPCCVVWKSEVTPGGAPSASFGWQHRRCLIPTVSRTFLTVLSPTLPICYTLLIVIMAPIDASLYSKLVRRFRDFLPMGSSTSIPGPVDKRVLTSIKGSRIPPPAPTELPYLPRELSPTRVTAELHPRTQEIVDECHDFFL